MSNTLVTDPESSTAIAALGAALLVILLDKRIWPVLFDLDRKAYEQARDAVLAHGTDEQKRELDAALKAEVA